MTDIDATAVGLVEPGPAPVNRLFVEDGRRPSLRADKRFILRE